METELPNRRPRDYLLLAAKGMAMGAADVVPGVSGGTIALLTGIYDELIGSLKNIGPANLVTLFKCGPAAFWREINGTFLVVLFAGVLVSIKTFAAVIAWCLENYPLLVWAFFSGLIAASVVMLWRKQEAWHWRQWLAFAVGVFVVLFISMARPAELPSSNWLLLGGGFIAIVAMILPGISGSFILLLLGLYSGLLAAVNNNDIVALLCFLVGAVLGLLSFSRILAWLLERYHTTTLAVLLGFLVGSLNVTWPWKVVLESTIDRHGEKIALVQANVLPADFALETQSDPMTVLVLCMVFFGIFLVLFTECVARLISHSSKKR